MHVRSDDRLDRFDGALLPSSEPGRPAPPYSPLPPSAASSRSSTEGPPPRWPPYSPLGVRLCGADDERGCASNGRRTCGPLPPAALTARGAPSAANGALGAAAGPLDRAFSSVSDWRAAAPSSAEIPTPLIENGESRPLPPPEPRGGTRPGGAVGGGSLPPAAPGSHIAIFAASPASISRTGEPGPEPPPLGSWRPAGKGSEKGPGGTAPSNLSILGAPRPRPRPFPPLPSSSTPSSDETEERSETRLALPERGAPIGTNVPRQRALRRPRCGDATAAGGHLLQLRKVVAAAARAAAAANHPRRRRGACCAHRSGRLRGGRAGQ